MFARYRSATAATRHGARRPAAHRDLRCSREAARPCRGSPHPRASRRPPAASPRASAAAPPRSTRAACRARPGGAALVRTRRRAAPRGSGGRRASASAPAPWARARGSRQWDCLSQREARTAWRRTRSPPRRSCPWAAPTPPRERAVAPRAPATWTSSSDLEDAPARGAARSAVASRAAAWRRGSASQPHWSRAAKMAWWRRHRIRTH
mmetsp:Transcript_14958/g.43151  ORF Transcript_14958/g.43151 Transcript_14958/m.43151 type:complete len:208 (+) Transcript_14958:1455-2078(+)